MATPTPNKNPKDVKRTVFVKWSGFDWAVQQKS
jgi:hypothetical protein